MSDLISSTSFSPLATVEPKSMQAVVTDQAKVVKQVEAQTVEKNIVEQHTERREVAQEIKDQEEQKAIEEVASKLQEFVNLIDKKLQFSVDEDSGRHVVTVSDKLSGDVIRQIPSEEVLRLARNLSDLAETASRSGKIITTSV